ncbi:MAG: hypothetical protein EPN99_08965, partial [Frankiales bacterium]
SDPCPCGSGRRTGVRPTCR